MKIFTGDNTQWADKVNFVDDSNTMLGYDLSQDCCEYANWFIDDKIWEGYPDNIKDYQSLEGYDGYRFDTKFIIHKEVSCDVWVAIFKIFKLNPSQIKEKYVHIFNSHNGYYSHGFEFENKAAGIKINGYL
jgi:hypothetical protein